MLSIAIIAKNNEAILARLLASLQPLRAALAVERQEAERIKTELARVNSLLEAERAKLIDN